MKKLLLTLSIALITATGWSQCNANFVDTLATWTANPYDVYFQNTSTGTSASAQFQWYFPTGASPSSSSSPDTVTVIFPGPGTYYVWLDVIDTANSCYDSIVYSVTVPGSALSGSATVTNATCGNCNGAVNLTVSGGTAPYSYNWSNGDTVQNLSNVCAGGYSVTITDAYNLTTTTSANVIATGGISAGISVSDSAPCPGDSVIMTAVASGGSGFTYLWSTGATTQSIGTSASGTYTVTVTNSSGCSDVATEVVTYNAGFSSSASSTNESCLSCCNGSATANASGGSGNFSYTWSNASTSASISSLCPGTYTVTIEDNNSGCTAVESATVNAFSCHSISGVIAQGQGARVYLIQENSGTLYAVDSTNTDSNGAYQFNGLCSGTFYIKAALLPFHVDYAFYLPTYYDSAALWSNANALVISNASYNNVNYSLLSGTNPGGPGFVGGLISQGANRDEGDPVPGVQVVLMNENEEVVAFTKTDANGEYGFSNVAYGTYLIHTDWLNKTSYPIELTLDASNASVSNGDFLVFGDRIRPAVPTGLEEVSGSFSSVYPNPADDRITIRSTESIEHLKIYSMIGTVVMEQSSNENELSLSLEQLNAGQYLIEVQGASNIERHLIVIR